MSPSEKKTDIILLEIMVFIEHVTASVVDPDPDPELFAGSGSGINSFGSGSGQYLTFPVKKSHFLNQMHKKLEYLAHIQYI